MYSQYVGHAKDWPAIAESVVAKLETAMNDGMNSGELSRILIYTATHTIVDGSEEIVSEQVVTSDDGDSLVVNNSALVVNYHTVKVESLSMLKEGSIVIQWFIRDYGAPVAEMLMYISKDATPSRFATVLEQVIVIDSDGDSWTLDDWFNTWIDRQQEQDITDSEAEDLED